MNAYVHEKEEKEEKMLPQGGGSGGVQIGLSVATQLNNVEFQRTHLL